MAHRTPEYYLWIEGVAVLYGSGTPPPRTYQTSGGPVEYARVRAIVPGRGLQFSRRLDVREHIVEARPAEVVLSQGVPFAGGPAPVETFGRLGFAGARYALRLDAGQTIYQDDEAPIVVTTEAPPSDVSVGDVVHIGREAFEVQAVDQVLRSIKFGRRGVLGTLPALHRYDPKTDVRPIVTPDPAFFRGRRAVIHELDGSGWVERWRGFIEDEPNIGGGLVSLSIAPLASELDRPLGARLGGVGLCRTHHAFGGFGDWPRRSSYLDVCETVAEGERYSVNASAPREHAPYIDGHPYIPVPEVTAPWHQSASDLALPVGHPRRCQVELTADGTVHDVTGYATINTGDLVPADPDPEDLHCLIVGGAVEVQPSGAPLTFSGVRSVRSAEWRSVSMMATGVGPEVHAWPGRLEERANAPSGLAPAGASGLDGGHLSATVDAAQGEVTVSRAAGSRVGASLTFAHGSVWDLQRLGDDTPSWFGADWRSGDGRERVDPHLRLPSEAVTLTEEAGGRREVAISADGGAQSFGVTIAEAWYGAGERWLALDAEVVIPAGGVLHMEARQGGDLLGTFGIVGCTAQVIDDAVVYVAELASELDAVTGLPLRTIAQERGGDPVSLSPVAAFTSGRVGEVLAELLCSSGGNGVTSTADRLSVGAGLTDGTSPDRAERGQDLDRGSLEAIPEPVGGAEFAPVWRAGDTVLDVVGGMLRAAGVVLDMRTDGAGRCLLTAVSLGLPVASSRLGHLTTRDITASTVSSGTEPEIFNRFVFEANHGPDGEPQVTQAVTHAASVDALDEESELVVPLSGVRLGGDVDIVSQLRPLFSRLALTLAHPRRQYSVGVSHEVGLGAQVGGTYQISHPLLISEAGVVGVDGAWCSLRSVDVDGWTGVARLELVAFGRHGSGWGPSLDVVGVLDAVTLAVAERQHSRETHPQTGGALVDLDGFALSAGDMVHLYPAGDMDGGGDVAVVATDRAARTITLQAPHGLADGGGETIGHIVPTSWPPALPHQAYAHIGRVEVV